ncbi:prepilin peptidase [Raineyella fluvialis]|uniref:Prepilin type IV endopeptidase peptidase domain-containing protein n=1 Tax=Raineyella fluvialis TaxID=2662261 RepID=A0A5Q2FHR8_9ACTN|nr:prepilin peptidase [Raineyella fluvialis]QGF24205.1 hypothetical protein Rai3103_11590 [Raineyella fluvialis]
MTSNPVTAVAIVAAAVTIGVLVAGATGPILRHLPRQAVAGCDLEDEPPDYVALAGRGFSLACGGLAAAASLTALSLAPVAWLPLWLVWASGLALLVAIDARTTWLPLRLTRAIWALGSFAVVTTLLPWSGATVSPTEVTRVLLGALSAGLFYLTLWRVGQGLGFGDVRISPVIGALGASVSWTGWWVALLAGSLLGALWGVARAVRGRRGPYAYGPWMWLGPAASLVLGAAGPFG